MSGNWLLIKRDLYERPNHHGYTGIRDEAGRYSKDVADLHMAHFGPNSAVREEDAPEFRAATFNDLVIAHLTKQRDTARAEARKAALEEAAALADQWSEVRLDEANAPIISGDVFTDDGVFVQSTADANAGYRLMDLAAAIRALIEHAPPKSKEAT